MFGLGFALMAVGGYLIDCAVQNRHPISTFTSILQNPKDAREILEQTKGTFQDTESLLDFSIPERGLSDLDLSHDFPNESAPAGKGKARYPAGASSIPGVTGGNGITGKVISFAAAQIGKPYIWGMPSRATWKPGKPIKGADCSGLIWAAYKSAGINIPATTAGQIIAGARVRKNELQPGDLVFPKNGHVMLYVGNGQTIEAPRTGERIKYSTVYSFLTARRYV